MIENDGQPILRDILANLQAINIKIERQDQRLTQVEEWLRGSVNTREERAENRAIVTSRLEGLRERVEDLEDHDKKNGERFFQVWSGIAIAIFLSLISKVVKL